MSPDTDDAVGRQRAFVVQLRVCALLLCVAGLASCFPRNGKPYEAGPATLIEDARQACQRHDMQARRMLLERIIREYPDSDEASLARQQLEKERSPGESCSWQLRNEGNKPTASTGSTRGECQLIPQTSLVHRSDDLQPIIAAL